ncbi:MAG: metal ABC transporter substrate-binding protein [Rhodobacteraceae bacterium]|nr:metal ABC transporter substrate-binding protein [Paracoccaceae bacterium]
MPASHLPKLGHLWKRMSVCLGAFLLAMTLPVIGMSAQAAEKLKVVTTFTVLQDIAQNVAGDYAVVESVTKPGAEIHGYQPTPRDLLRAQDADLIVRNGMNLELWFEQFLNNLGDVPSVTISAGVDPILIGEGSYNGKPNPHAWMSLTNAMIYIDNLKNAFSEADPENASGYAANAKAYKARLMKEIEPLKVELNTIPQGQRWLATCEGAFSYLARDYGLHETYLWPMNADQTGTPQQVRKVIDTVREQKIPAVFCESTVNVGPAKQVARETGAKYGGVLYVDSLSEEGGPVPTYLDLLKVTSETIVKGLTGAE